jgi:hypothetical protein
MNKGELLKKLNNGNRGNLFSVEIPSTTKDHGNKIKELVDELEQDGKIKLREFVQREYSVYLHGISGVEPNAKRGDQRESESE